MHQAHRDGLNGRALGRFPTFLLGAMGWHGGTITLISILLILAYRNIFGVYTADDVFFRQTFDGTYSLALASYANGRFIPGFIYQLLSNHGIEIYDFWAILQFFAFIVFSALSYVFVTCLGLRLSRLETLATASVIAFIPYSIKLLANKNNALNAILSYGFICLAIYVFQKYRKYTRVILSSLFIFLSFSCYQTAVYYFMIYVLGYYFFNGDKNLEVVKGIGQGILACAIAVLAYSVIFKLTLGSGLAEMGQAAYADVAQFYAKSRSGLNDLYGLFSSVVVYLHSIGRIFLGAEPILPTALKIVALLIFSVAYHHWSNAANAEDATDADRFQLKKRCTILLMLILGASSPMHLLLVNNWISPRVYGHAGAVWAILLLSALVLGPQKWRRRFLVGTAAFALGLLFYSTRTADIYAKLYQRDLQLGREIVTTLMNQPGYRQGNQIAVIGKIPKASRQTNDIFDYYDMVPSKFHQPWSKIAFLEEASGQKFQRPSRKFTGTATDICAALRKRDTLFYAKVTEVGAVICLPSTWQGSPE